MDEHRILEVLSKHVIWCETEEEAREFMDLLGKNTNIKWNTSGIPSKNTTNWGDYMDRTCYRCCGERLMYADLDYYTGHYYDLEIARFSDMFNECVRFGIELI